MRNIFFLFVNISLGYKLLFCNAPAEYQQTTLIILAERGGGIIRVCQWYGYTANLYG